MSVAHLHCKLIHIFCRLEVFSLAGIVSVWLCLKLIGRNYSACGSASISVASSATLSSFPWTRASLLCDVLLPRGRMEEIAAE
jgi:hypothetical protein